MIYFMDDPKKPIKSKIYFCVKASNEMCLVTVLILFIINTTDSSCEETFFLMYVCMAFFFQRQIKFHFFEYSTQQSTRIPDLSTCFTPSSTMNIQLRVSGRKDNDNSKVTLCQLEVTWEGVVEW